MTGLKRNFAASSDNELVVSLRHSRGQVTHFAWACPIKSNRRWPSGLVGSRTGPRSTGPFHGCSLKGCNSVYQERKLECSSASLLSMNSHPQKPHTRTPLCLFPWHVYVQDLWRMESHRGDAHVGGAGMFDNSFVDPLTPQIIFDGTQCFVHGYSWTRELSHCICNMITIGRLFSFSLDFTNFPCNWGPNNDHYPHVRFYPPLSP